MSPDLSKGYLYQVAGSTSSGFHVQGGLARLLLVPGLLLGPGTLLAPDLASAHIANHATQRTLAASIIDKSL